MLSSQHSPLAIIWQTIHDACLPSADAQLSEGADASSLCPSWRIFTGFADWARAHGYQNGLYLLRIDPALPYAPDNCYWANALRNGKNVPQIITAFGLRKTISAWTDDPHAMVDEATFRYRLKRGWDAERAISTPPPERNRHASGATPSTIAIGAQFARLTVIGTCELGRNRQGNPSYSYRCRCSCGTEVVIEASCLLYSHTSSCGCLKREINSSRTTVHGETGTRLYTQWQSVRRHAEALRASLSAELPTIEAAWATDFRAFRDWARAHGYTDQYHVIRHDTTRGYTADNCQWVDRRTQTHQTTPIAMYTAFEETKPLTLWAEDVRCVSNYQTLLRRVRQGWELVSALTTPNTHRPSRAMTAFGETKALHAWTRDARCVIGKPTLEQRLRDGWTLEAALTTSRTAPPLIVTAYGESKTLTAWEDDPRCVVPIATLRFRIQNGYEPERALTTPVRSRPPRPYTAWGETKPLYAWVADARCVVSQTTLTNRLAEGWTILDALLTPGEELPGNTILLTVFGETKSLSAWSRDARCRVSRGQLMRRLQQQWDGERALTTPARPSHRHSSGYTMTTIPVGAQFGLLTVTGAYTRVQFPSGGYGYLYPCACACGTPDHRVSANNLLSGQVTACGCRRGNPKPT